jgi:hypothetical protein
MNLAAGPIADSVRDSRAVALHLAWEAVLAVKSYHGEFKASFMQQVCPSLVAQSESVEQPFSHERLHTPAQQTCPPEQLLSVVHRVGHAVQKPDAAQEVGVAARPAQSLFEEHGGNQL